MANICLKISSIREFEKNVSGQGLIVGDYTRIEKRI